MGEASGAFAQAYSTVENVERLVEDRVKSASDTAKELQSTAMKSIDALSRVNLNFGTSGPPAAPVMNMKIDAKFDLPAINPTSFGSITSVAPVMPALGGVPDIPNLDIPEFVSSINSINIPEPPAWSAPDAPPEAPADQTVDLPATPSLAMPDLPLLSEITVPTFDGLTLPTFDATAPEFEGTALPGILQWSEPEYRTVIIDEMVDVVRRLWSGGSGIPPAVEQAMFDRAADREDLSASRDIGSVSEEFSLRGFTMPNGVQAARVDQMRQELAVKKLGLNRDLTIQIAQWQVENVRFACQQAVAAENVYVNLFTNMAARMFEAAKFQIESQLNIYNAQVSLFNARMNGYQISASVFNTLVQAELAKIEVFKAEVDAEIARGQVNEQKVRTYTAQVQALSTQIDVYKAQMQGAEIQSNIIRNGIEAFKAKVQAYGEQVGAQKTRFEAYEAQVRGESAKAGIIDAEARAYAALIQGKASVADISMKRADVTIQKNRVLIEGYAASLDAEKMRIQSQLSVIQSGAQAYIADTQRFSAVAQAEGTKAQLQVSAKETELRTNVAFYQAQVQAYIGNMEQMIRKASLIIDALKAAGSISSTLAAGAMAGVHVGATLTGSGSVGASGTDAYSNAVSKQESRSENYNYDGGKV